MKIKFLSLNVWNGGRLWENLEDFLKKNTFDIMFFQEVFNGHGEQLPKSYKTLDEFKHIFPDYNCHYAPAFGDMGEYGSIDRGNAIFSKLPITLSKATFFDLPYRVFNEQKERDFEFTPRVIEHCIASCGSTNLNLFNHHGIWGRDGLDTPRRLKMAETIVKAVEGKENVILAGDFNLSPNTEAVKKIEKHLQSVFGTTLKSTFNMRQKEDPGYATAAVDMLFVSPEIKILDKSCPDVDVSDHFPLTATLEI